MSDTDPTAVKNWLDNAKIGDTVIVRDGYSYATLTPAVISRETPKRVTVGNTTYRREDGRAVGHTLYPMYLIEPTQEVSRLRAIVGSWWMSGRGRGYLRLSQTSSATADKAIATMARPNDVS